MDVAICSCEHYEAQHNQRRRKGVQPCNVYDCECLRFGAVRYERHPTADWAKKAEKYLDFKREGRPFEELRQEEKGDEEYVLAFAFAEDSGRVILVKKARPTWQAGKLNGVGGRVEQDDKSVRYAAGREFYEETGLEFDFRKWRSMGALLFPRVRVHVYTMMVPTFDGAGGSADEPLIFADPFDLPDDVLPELRWMVPMALNVASGTEDVRFKANYKRNDSRPNGEDGRQE